MNYIQITLLLIIVPLLGFSIAFYLSTRRRSDTLKSIFFGLIAMAVTFAILVLSFEYPYLGISPSGEVVDSGPKPIEPYGTIVTDDTKLSVGDIVQVKWEGSVVLPDGKVTNESWWNGEVIDLQEDGTVKIHYSGWKSEWDEVVSRERLRVGSPTAETGDEL